MPLAGLQNSRKSWWLPMEQLSEGGGGRGRAGWKLWARGYPACCPRRQASPESGPRHVEGQGLSRPCELRNLPEPTHQPRPCQAMFLPHLLTPSGQSLGLPGRQRLGDRRRMDTAPLSLGSCSLPKGTFFLGKLRCRQANASWSAPRTKPGDCFGPESRPSGA